jgi:type II secretory pathway pseudopilin PulG
VKTLGHRRRRRRQGGFTLVELMISLVMFSFAIAGVLAVAVSMASGFREQKQAIGAEGSSRAAMEFLADAVRGASPGLLGGNSATLEDISVTAGNCPVGPFLMADNVGAASTDELTVVFAYGSVVTSSMTLYTPRAAAITVVDGSQFQLGDHVLITNFGTGHLVRITSVAGNVLNLDTASGCAISLAASIYNPGSLVIRAARAKFYVAALDGIPTLWMDPDAEGPAAAEPLAEGIEDFQVELGKDPANDGILTIGAAGDDDEWAGNNAADTQFPLTDIIRGVRVSLVARAVAPAGGAASFFRPAAGNHAAAATADQFRRRVLSSVLEVRNLGGSP